MPSFLLETDALSPEGIFDPRYTCDRDNSSPELRWSHAPEGTESFAVVFESAATLGSVAMVDSRERPVPVPSSSVFAHWVVYQIPKSVLHLPAGIPPQDTLPNGIRQGLNSLNKLGYTGPCPPRGARPRLYTIRVYALREATLFPARLNRDELLAHLAGPSRLVLAQAEVQGRYSRTSEIEREKAG